MSGSSNVFHGQFTGAAGDITVPFRPRRIKFWATGGVWGIKTDDMAGAAYLSSTAADSGVTITADGFDVANGADVNVAGQQVYYECMD